jgi:hypothetical protein
LEVGCPTTTGLERLRVEKICEDNTPGLRETVALRMCAQRMCPAKRIAVFMILPLAGIVLISDSNSNKSILIFPIPIEA